MKMLRARVIQKKMEDFSKAEYTQHERQEVTWAALRDYVLSDKGISSSDVKNSAICRGSDFPEACVGSPKNTFQVRVFCNF